MCIPSSTAVENYSLRSYTKWGWKLENGRLKQFASLQNAITSSLRLIIAWDCLSGCDRNCECKENSLHCTNMSDYCAIHDCSNQNVVDEDEEKM